MASPAHPARSPARRAAVGVAAGLAIWLRERGSPESKPVGAPRSQPGT